MAAPYRATTTDLPHGTYNTYNRYGCRCPECRQAKYDHQRAALARKKAELAADPTAAPHGSNNTYTHWGCRCRACKTAHNDYQWRLTVSKAR